MASAVDSRLAYARLSAVATASRLPTANRGSNNSYTTSWDTTAASARIGSLNARLPKKGWSRSSAVTQSLTADTPGGLGAGMGGHQAASLFGMCLSAAAGAK